MTIHQGLRAWGQLLGWRLDARAAPPPTGHPALPALPVPGLPQAATGFLPGHAPPFFIPVRPPGCSCSDLAFLKQP